MSLFFFFVENFVPFLFLVQADRVYVWSLYGHFFPSGSGPSFLGSFFLSRETGETASAAAALFKQESVVSVV